MESEVSASGRVKGYLEALGLPSDMTSFVNRITIQKLVYLLREYDPELKFGYFWYIHGPYSSQLTRTLFEDGSVIPEQLTTRELQAAHEVRNFLSEDLYSIDQLELIVSLIYLMKHGPEQGLVTKKAVVEFLDKEKPQFSADEIDLAWKKIEAHPMWGTYTRKFGD